MLLAFLLATTMQIAVFIQYPVFGATQPLVLLVALLVYQLAWLSAVETVLFTVISGYVVDVFAGLQPGSVLIAMLVALSVFIATKRRYEPPAWLNVLLAIWVYEALLWILSGGWFGWTLLSVLLLGPALSSVVYVFLYVGVKQFEARL